MSKGGTAANSLNKKLVRTIFYDITDNENNVKLASSRNLMSDDDEDDDEEDDDEDDDEDEEGDENIEENTESSSFEAYFSSCDGGHNEVDMNHQDQAKETNLDGNFIYFLDIPEDPVFGIGYYLRFFFFSKVVPDTNYSKKNFAIKFFVLKKGI